MGSVREVRRLLVLAALPFLLAGLTGENPLHVLSHLEHVACSCAQEADAAHAWSGGDRRGRLEEPTPDHACRLCGAGVGLGVGLHPPASFAPLRAPDQRPAPLDSGAARSPLPRGCPARGPPLPAHD